MESVPKLKRLVNSLWPLKAENHQQLYLTLFTKG